MTALRIAAAVAAAGCAAVLAAACGSAVGSTPASAGAPPGSTAPASGPPSTAPASTAPASTAPASTGPTVNPAPPIVNPAPPAGPPPCQTADLSASVDAAAGGAAAGNRYYPIQFKDISSGSCNLYGYPGVSFVTGSGGNQIGAPAGEIATHPRQFVDLAPGQVVHAELQIASVGNFPASTCNAVTAQWLRIYPPNQTAPLYARFSSQTCSGNVVTMNVETVQPGANES